MRMLLGVMATGLLFGCAAPQAWGQRSSLMQSPPLRPIAPARARVQATQYRSGATQAMPVGLGPTAAPDSNTRPAAADAAENHLSDSQYDAAGRAALAPQDQVACDPYDDAPSLMLDRASWTYQQPPPLRVFQKQDVVTIRVDEITRVMAEGAAENRKRTLYEAILTDWIRLVDFRFRPDPQINGDPAIAAESNNRYRAESSVESRESMTFNIAANVVDIRPNGNLVLEARKAIRVNDNLWETSLTGICRAQDIAPDNVVLSKDLIDLEIRKEDRGHLRDSYSRGWLQRFVDRFGFF